MDRFWFEFDNRYIAFLFQLKRLVFTGYRFDGLIYHLGTKRTFTARLIISQMIQRDRVKGAGGLSEGDEQIASESKFLLDSSKHAGLLSSRLKLDGYGSFQLPPSFYVFASLNVFLYGLRTDIASSSNIVGGRPQRPAPQFLFQIGKQNQKLPGCSSF